MIHRPTLIIILVIELIDELIGGAMDAAWPIIKQELNLSYSQIGICMGIPAIVGGLLDPFVSLYGDIGNRRRIILIGGLFFVGALLARSLSPSFFLLLISLIAFYPASGAFVNLSQANLMDLQPHRRENNMAAWALCGSLGMLLGPLVLSGLTSVGGSWRYFFFTAAAMSLCIAVWQWRITPDTRPKPASFHQIKKMVADACRTQGVVRWLVLIQAGDLMIDVLVGFLALYFVEVGHASPAQAGLAVAVWTGVGLAGDLLLLPLLKKMSGLRYLRISAVIVLGLFPAFLMTPWFWLKLVLIGLLGFFNSGWYAIIKAQLYEALPEQSATALALFNVSCLIGGLIPIALGLIAEIFSLSVSMWLLLLGPVILLFGIKSPIYNRTLSGPK